MPERIKVTEKQLAAAIAVWLKKIPTAVWERLIEQKILAFYRRESRVHNLDSEIAAHIASEMTRHDWQVTHPEPVNHGAPLRRDEQP